jgi:hypothetical protein
VRLRNIPGIVVVPFGDPADLVIQLSCLIARAENRDVGYVWSEVALDAKTGVELQGPSIFAVGGASARQPWLLSGRTLIADLALPCKLVCCKGAPMKTLPSNSAFSNIYQPPPSGQAHSNHPEPVQAFARYRELLT